MAAKDVILSHCRRHQPSMVAWLLIRPLCHLRSQAAKSVSET